MTGAILSGGCIFSKQSVYILVIHTSSFQFIHPASNNRWVISIIFPYCWIGGRSLSPPSTLLKVCKYLWFLDFHFCFFREKTHSSLLCLIVIPNDESMSGTADTIIWRRVAIFISITKECISKGNFPKVEKTTAYSTQKHTRCSFMYCSWILTSDFPIHTIYSKYSMLQLLSPIAGSNNCSATYLLTFFQMHCHLR